MSYKLDAVFCVDATNQMKDTFEVFKEFINGLYVRTKGYANDSGRDIDSLRVKIITFTSFKIENNPFEESRFYSLPEEQNELNDFVKSITFKTAYQDEPKNSLEALAMALKSDWSTGGDKRRHLITLISYSKAYPLGTFSKEPNYPKEMPKDLAELSTWWEKNENNYLDHLATHFMLNYVPNIYPWNMIKSWNRYWFNTPTAFLNDVDRDQWFDFLFMDI